MASLVEKGESWKVEAQTITEQLARTRLWRHRIRFPGDPAGETTIGSAGMAGSLKQIGAPVVRAERSTDMTDLR
jgi:hypothetical protein